MTEKTSRQFKYEGSSITILPSNTLQRKDIFKKIYYLKKKLKSKKHIIFFMLDFMYKKYIIRNNSDR